MLLFLLTLIYQQNVLAQTSTTVQADSAVTNAVMQQDSVMTDTVQQPVVVWPQTLQIKLDSLLECSDLPNTSQVGIMVFDLTDDTPLYSYNARHTMRPASIMKVITAVTALDKLGGAYQFKTRLKYTGEIIDSTRTLVGDVIIVGGMDPRLGHDDLLAFAESLKQLNIDTIRGSICTDGTMKDADKLGEGWCWDDDNPVLSACVYNRKDNLGEVFLKVLQQANIFVDGQVTEKKAPLSAVEICSRSHTIDQILNRMMKESDNLYAESMFYNMALAKGRTATAANARSIEQDLIRKLKLNPSKYRIADGSGLSLYNYLSPELEVQLLRYAYRNSNIYSHLYPSLPVAGIDGTLAKRMHGTKAYNNVHAKTGTLTGISSLAGYATSSNNHLLAFCIINQGVLSSSPAKSMQDKICSLLCE